MPLAENFIKLLTPFDCLYCGQEGSIVCLDCQAILASPVVSRCYRCRRATEQHATCPSCRRHSALQHVWVGTELTATTKKLLYAFKFERAQAAHQVMARVMTAHFPALRDSTIVLPVPTATSRVRQRGYDHARLLAKEVARIKGLQYADHLVRLNQTRQVGAKRDERKQQLTNAFRVRHPEELRGKNILLVDDVLTTGATLEEAARSLKNAGVRHVAALVFAHKV